MSTGPDRSVLFFFSLLAVGGFFYARSKYLQTTGGKPVEIPPSPEPLAATFQLPTEGSGGETRSISMSHGSRIIVTGTDLAGAGLLWRAAESSDAIGVDTERKSAGVGAPSTVTFTVHATAPGTGTVYFTLVDPQQDVVRSWNLDVTVE